MAGRTVSNSVIRRLPRYYRFLSELRQKGTPRISSGELAAHMNLTASQIRQDLNCFGGFGQQGYGYNVDQLQYEIGRILGLDTEATAILIGAGNLGQTIATHINFKKCGFKLVAIFDQNEKIIGDTVGDLKISDMKDLSAYCRKVKPDVAIMCIPRAHAQEIVDELLACGVFGFWNFSQRDLVIEDERAHVENIRLADSLMALRYHIGK